MNAPRQPVAVVIGATSKWQADGRNTLLAHGKVPDDSDLPVGVRRGVGGAIAQKFAREGFFVAPTTRDRAPAAALGQALGAHGGASMIVGLDLVPPASISHAFATMRARVGDPEVVIYNAGSLEGRELPPEKELLGHLPLEPCDTAHHSASRGPFLVAEGALPAMRARGAGPFLISNNAASSRGRKRLTGQSLDYPRVMRRTPAQGLAEE
jgi:NAD(P)-dependent dehydrogenase (short-subunit alcohol dehydrogenase family)